MSGGQTITWSTGGYGGSIIADLVQNVGGYIALNALQGGTNEVLRAQYINRFGPSCSFSAHIYAKTISTTGNISLPNNGVGLTWGNNNSHMYGDANLHISTDD